MTNTSTNLDKGKIKDTSTPHLSLSGRLRDRDEEHIFPIVNCTECKLADAPYSISVLSNGEEFITRWWCLNCKHSTLERPEIRGWVSLQALEECNWETEL